MLPKLSSEQESQLVERARTGDETAFGELIEPWRRPLFAYIYRMVTHRQDAEDLLQDVLLRVLDGLHRYRGESQFKTWLFGIATHVCMDHLRHKKRWRVEAQLIGEREAEASGEQIDQIGGIMSRPDFVFEVREHIAFCFACIGRTLPPEEQAVIMLREVLGFSNQETAAIVGLSEPVVRHRLSSARSTMIQHYEGLCRLISKDGVCWQCKGLQDFAGPDHRGPDLVHIEVRPGVAVTPESLFDARLEIVRQAELEDGTTRSLHDSFFEGLSRREESRT